jgi:hypothetical protein
MVDGLISASSLGKEMTPKDDIQLNHGVTQTDVFSDDEADYLEETTSVESSNPSVSGGLEILTTQQSTIESFF